MQIQAPRTLFAEAAMGVLFLSYADPELAAEVILRHFESSPHPNQPCMREDDSYNMVADDGQICGTAPEWGFPIWCCDKLFARTGDLRWLRRLYPKAAAYLRWWLWAISLKEHPFRLSPMPIRSQHWLWLPGLKTVKFI